MTQNDQMVEHQETEETCARNMEMVAVAGRPSNFLITIFMRSHIISLGSDSVTLCSWFALGSRS